MDLDLKQFLLKPGNPIHLNELDPGETSGFDGDKDQAKDLLKELTGQLDDLQERLYAQHKQAILVILQGMDTCGKDGTVEHVFEGVNPQGVRVVNFKAPTPTELEHDFLWRVHQKAPAKGEIVIFNRSQYEDVLIVRVHDLVPEKVWRKRYDHINDFERLLADEGTIILKFFLHISKEEQKERLLARLEKPRKQWKFDPVDLKERSLWGDYMKAYQDALEKTSTDWAPWYIVPADHKWFRNLIVASTLVKTLQDLDPEPERKYSAEEIEQYQNELQKE